MDEFSENKLLVLSGFKKDDKDEVRKKILEKLANLKGAELRAKLRELPEEEAGKIADNHEMDVTADQLIKTGYPTPFGDIYFHANYEGFQRPLESFYFWSLNHLNDLGFAHVDKVTDLFSAAEARAFFGMTQQRLGIEQDKVTQFLTAIGRLVKDLFQIVREIRIIKERLKYYKDASDEKENIRESAEIALKGLYIDLVEGGTKNAGSVFGMARDVGFVALPDLFFTIHPRTTDDVTETVDKLVDFNNNVKGVLKRKLYQYLAWKESTSKELLTREGHTIKYLRQHYDAVQLYMAWLKPYLRHIKRLTANQKQLTTANIVSAFEGSTVEIEILARQIPQNNKKVYTCLLLSFNYRTSPTLPFQAEGYQRGPLHVGNVDITWRPYAWDEETISRYIKMRNDESLEILSTINTDIQAAMTGLGDDLNLYLEEASGKKKTDEEKKPEKPKREHMKMGEFFEPFTAPFEGFKDQFSEWFSAEGKKKEQAEADTKKETGDAGSLAKKLAFTHYKNFKKMHKMVAW